MKATFDVTVKIDGATAETIFSMRDGVENMDVEIIDKVTKAATNFACTLKRRICREALPPPENIRKYAQILDFVQKIHSFTTR